MTKPAFLYSADTFEEKIQLIFKYCRIANFIGRLRRAIPVLSGLRDEFRSLSHVPSPTTFETYYYLVLFRFIDRQD